MLNGLNLGGTIRSIKATDETSDKAPVFISSFEVPTVKKLSFRGVLICLFYKCTGGRLKVIILEGQRGPNTLSDIQCFGQERLEAFADDLNQPVHRMMLRHFAELSGHDQDELVRLIWSAALCNLSIDALAELMKSCRIE